MYRITLLLVLLLAPAMLISSSTSALAGEAAGEVNVYSYREATLIKPLFKVFTKQTGIKVNMVFAKKGLLERLKYEGDKSLADLVVTTEIGQLNDLVAANLTQTASSADLTTNIPERFHHPDGQWHALTSRARILYVSRERVPEGSIKSYEDLAAKEWQGRICMRSGKHVYNVALIASMIAHHGEAKAEKWLSGVKANLAQRPQGNDRAQIKAIAAGECDIAIGNSYYFGKMMDDPKQRPAAEASYLVFPNQVGRGTHVNVSGIALTRAAPHKQAALKLMAFLSGAEAQGHYAERNSEYPVRAGVPWSDRVASWGKFKADQLPLVKIAESRSAAIRMADRVDFDG